MKTRHVAPLVGIALTLGGCIPQLIMMTQEPTSAQYAGQSPVRVVNQTGSALCSVQVARVGDFNIDNWLSGEKPVAPGEVIELGLLPQSGYMVSVASCDALLQAGADGLDLSAPVELVIVEAGKEVQGGPPAEGFERRTLQALRFEPRPVAAASFEAPRQDPFPTPDQGAPARATPQPQSAFFSLTLKNNCRETVPMFIGDKPRFGSGTSTSIGSNTISSFSGNAPETFWITDKSGNGVSAFTVSPGSHRMQILSSCAGFAPD